MEDKFAYGIVVTIIPVRTRKDSLLVVILWLAFVSGKKSKPPKFLPFCFFVFNSVHAKVMLKLQKVKFC